MIPALHTAQDHRTLNRVLQAGQQGIEADTLRSKTGDGTTPWRDLPYTGGPLTGRAGPDNLLIAGDSYLDPNGITALPPHTIGDRLADAFGLPIGRVANIAVSGSMAGNHFTGCSYAAVWNQLERRRSAAPYTPNVGAVVFKWGTNEGIRGINPDNIGGYKAGLRAVIRAAQSGSMYPHNDTTVSRTGTWLSELLWTALPSEPFEVTAHTTARPWGYGTGCWRSRTVGARVNIAVPADHTGTVDVFLIGSYYGANYDVLVDNVTVFSGTTEHLGAAVLGTTLVDERCGDAVTVTGLTRGVTHQVSLVVTALSSGTAQNPGEFRFAGWSMRCLEGTDPLIVACQTPIVPAPAGFWIDVDPGPVRAFNRALAAVAAEANEPAGIGTWPVTVAATETVSDIDTFPDGAGHPNNAGAALFAGAVLDAYTGAAGPGSSVLWHPDWATDDTGARDPMKLWIGSGNPTGFEDQFNRTNSTTTMSAPWTAVRGVWGISSNAAYPATAGGSPFNLDIVLAESSLAEARLAVLMGAAAAAGNNNGIVFRAVDGDNHVSLVQSVSFATWLLRATVAGSIVVNLAIAGPMTAGTLIEIVYSGTSITVSFNGVPSSSGTQTVTQFTTATKVGFIAPEDTTVARWDYITAGHPFTDLAADDYFLDSLNSELYGPYTGSSWPATTVRTNRAPRFTTAARPTAAAMGAGGAYYDTTLNKPVWSNGTNYRDAAGTVV